MSIPRRPQLRRRINAGAAALETRGLRRCAMDILPFGTVRFHIGAPTPTLPLVCHGLPQRFHTPIGLYAEARVEFVKRVGAYLQGRLVLRAQVVKSVKRAAKTVAGRSRRRPSCVHATADLRVPR
jgi:hypothetical protein